MGFISNLFGGRPTETSTEEDAEQTVIDRGNLAGEDAMLEANAMLEQVLNMNESTVFSPNSALLDIAKQMAEIPALRHLSKDAKELAFHSKLRAEDCKPLMSAVSRILETVVEEIQSLADPIQMIYEFKRMCAKISNHTFLREDLTYETLLETDGFSCLESEAQLLKHFQLYLPGIYAGDDPDFTQLSVDLVDANNIYCKLVEETTQLRVEAKKLIEDITNYANAINTTKAKHRLSVDWNGKKQPLMAMGQQLNVRRSTFLEVETKLNERIADLEGSYPELHRIFRSSCNYFITELDKKLEEQRPDETVQLKKLELKERYRIISASHYQMETFLSKTIFYKEPEAISGT